MIEAGNRLPSIPVKLIDASGTTDTDTLAVLGKGTVVMFGVPGAFTPGCDTSHLPGFLAAAAKFRALGVDRVVCAAANDHHVLRAWAERSEALGKIDFIADPRAAFADTLGVGNDNVALGGRRYRRCAMIIRDSIVENLFVEDAPGVTVSGASAILLALQASTASVGKGELA